MLGAEIDTIASDRDSTFAEVRCAMSDARTKAAMTTAKTTIRSRLEGSLPGSGGVNMGSASKRSHDALSMESRLCDVSFGFARRRAAPARVAQGLVRHRRLLCGRRRVPR